MATSWAFIFELVLAIVEQSFFNEDLQPDYVALRNWALVCKSIAHDAQRLLFRDVRLRSPESLEAFVRATDPANSRGAVLGGYVCRRCLRSGMESFDVALLRCPNVYELHVLSDQTDLHPLDQPIITALGVRSATIKALTVTSNTLPIIADGATDALPIQLLHALPSVEFLTLHGLPSLARTPGARHPGPLYEFCWNIVVPWHEPENATIAHLNWFLHNSVDSLRVLRFGTQGTVTRYIFKAIALRYGARLHSLTLERRADRHLEAIALFPALKELVLGWVNGEDIGGLFAACPAAIQHLAIRGITAFNIESLVDLVRSSPDVRCISYFYADCPIETLRAACLQRGVVLRRCEHFPPRVQPLRAPDFPRSLHVDNFKAMLPA